MTYVEIRYGKNLTLFDSVLLLSTGLAGIIVTYLMFVSTHPLVQYNLNILWLNPFNVIAAVCIWVKPMRIPLFVFQIFNFLFLILALFAFALSLQSFNDATFPLIVLLLMRYSRWVVRIKHKLFRKTKSIIHSNLKKQ